MLCHKRAPQRTIQFVNMYRVEMLPMNLNFKKSYLTLSTIIDTTKLCTRLVSSGIQKKFIQYSDSNAILKKVAPTLTCPAEISCETV